MLVTPLLLTPSLKNMLKLISTWHHNPWPTNSPDFAVSFYYKHQVTCKLSILLLLFFFSSRIGWWVSQASLTLYTGKVLPERFFHINHRKISHCNQSGFYSYRLLRHFQWETGQWTLGEHWWAWNNSTGFQPSHLKVSWLTVPDFLKLFGHVNPMLTCSLREERIRRAKVTKTCELR